MLKRSRAKLLIVLFSLTAIYLTFVKKNKMKALRRNKFLAEYLDISAIFEEHVTPVQPIHIVTVMTSLEDIKTFPLQFKSILYHRSSPVVLHLFLNSDLQQRVIETLLSTWPADQVYYEIYRIEETINRVTLSVILNAFRRLSEFTKEMVFMSPRIIFTSDVKDWIPKCDDVTDCATLFLDHFKCTDLNEHNCEEIPQVAFLNLEENEEFLRINVTEAVFQNEQIKLLPCHRTPLHLQSLQNSSDRCYDYATRIKSSSVYVIRDDLLAGESLESDVSTDLKEAIRTIEASEPRNRLYMSSFLSFEFGLMDGNDSFISLNPESEELESHSMSNNSLQTTTKSPRNVITNFCENFLEIAHLKRVTHIFYHYGKNIKKLDAETSDKIETTLLTALSLDRIGTLEIMLTHWTGPAAVLFYVSDSEASYQLPRLLSSSSVFRNKSVMDRIAIHLVYKTLTFNPINYLRNVLLNNSLTSHNVYIDVDLVPNPGVYESIQKTLKNNKNSNFSDKLFMIPAFQATTRLEQNFPKNKGELINLIKHKVVSGYNAGLKQVPGHHSTNYDKWVKTNSTYEAAYVRYFEPYLVVARSLPVRFNEDLVERMQDKIAYVRTFRAMGFKFYVLPDDFIIHLPHPESHGKKIFHSEPKFAQCDRMMNKRHEAFLRKIYPKAKI